MHIKKYATLCSPCLSSLGQGWTESLRLRAKLRDFDRDAAARRFGDGVRLRGDALSEEGRRRSPACGLRDETANQESWNSEGHALLPLMLLTPDEHGMYARNCSGLSSRSICGLHS